MVPYTWVWRVVLLEPLVVLCKILKIFDIFANDVRDLLKKKRPFVKKF